MGGDPPTNGDHPDAKTGLRCVQLSAAGKPLEASIRAMDMSGAALAGNTCLCVGAVVNPGATDLNAEVARMDEKLNAGAQFFQSQAIYDADAYERFARASEHLGAKVLAGVIPLKSVSPS